MNEYELVRPKYYKGIVGQKLTEEVSGAMGFGDEDVEKNKDEGEPTEEQEVEVDEPEEAEEPIRKRVCPLPSPEEQRRHRITHLPYRSK